MKKLMNVKKAGFSEAVLGAVFMACAAVTPLDAVATPVVNATIDYGANEIHYVVLNPDNDVFTVVEFSEIGIPGPEIKNIVSNTDISDYIIGSGYDGLPVWQNNSVPNQKDIVDLLLKYDDTNINEFDIPLTGTAIIGSGNQIGNCYNGAGWCVDYTIQNITGGANNPVPAPGALLLTLVGLAGLGHARRRGRAAAAA